MEEAIKKAIKEFSEMSSQINLDSQAARDALSYFIYEEIKICQNQKDQENIKTKKGWTWKSATWRAVILRIKALQIKEVKIIWKDTEGRVGVNFENSNSFRSRRIYW